MEEEEDEDKKPVCQSPNGFCGTSTDQDMSKDQENSDKNSESAAHSSCSPCSSCCQDCKEYKQEEEEQQPLNDPSISCIHGKKDKNKCDIAQATSDDEKSSRAQNGTSDKSPQTTVTSVVSGGHRLYQTSAAQTQSVAINLNAKSGSNNNSNNKQRTENNLAAIMMGYVLVFLICHSPRLLLNLHELTTIRNAMACGRAGHKTFAVWSLIVMHLSHLLLVINSSINILIYCCLSQKFRVEGKAVLVGFARATRRFCTTLSTCGRKNNNTLYNRRANSSSLGGNASNIDRTQFQVRL